MEVISTRKEKVIYRDGDNAVKIFSEKFPKSDILNEALNQARVEETGLPIPALKSVSVVDGQWAITMEYVEGKTLLEIMKENPDNIKEYMNLFVDLQLEVQSKKCPLLNKLKDKMNRKISSLGNIIDATTRYELHTRLESKLRETVRLMLQERICFLHCTIEKSLLICTLICSVKRPIPQSSMYNSGCR